MELLAEISDKELGFKPRPNARYTIRRATRAVLVDNGKVALIHSSRFNYYKLPGGGIDANASIGKAFAREVLEETGYKARITMALGAIIEYRSRTGLLQVSYCFTASPIGKQGRLRLTSKEKAKRQELVWASGIREAIRLVKANKSKAYEARFMVARDALVLNEK